jgi:hypothetical protein
VGGFVDMLLNELHRTLQIVRVRRIPLQGAGSSGRPERRWGASYWTQIRILFLRAVKTRRFDSLSTQDVVQFILVGLLSGGLAWTRSSHTPCAGRYAWLMAAVLTLLCACLRRPVLVEAGPGQHRAISAKHQWSALLRDALPSLPRHVCQPVHLSQVSE